MGTLDNVDVVSPKSQPQRARSKKSDVWEHFTVKNFGDDCYKAYCNRCNKSYAYSTGPKLSGTSHLKRHIETGACHVSGVQDNNVPDSLELKNHPSSEMPKKRKRGLYGVFAIPFSQKCCNEEIARMVILHDYPLDMVEHPGFIEFVRTLQPEFEEVSSVAIYSECMDIYSMEKTTLANLLSEIPGRVSLSLNWWTVDETMGYAVLSGHFIDNDWTLHRRLLNVVMIPDPDSEAAFSNAVLSCLSGWGLESKLFAVTLDRSFASIAVTGNLRNLLSIKYPHMVVWQGLIGSCYGQILSSLALEAINAMSDTIQKVRNCVKYVKTSELNEEKFIENKIKLEVKSKKNLVLDNCTRWDSTYHMLSAASELKLVIFSFMGPSDAPDDNEWRKIEILVDYLKCFYDAANILTAQKYPTADQFFIKVCSIKKKLHQSASSEDLFVDKLIQPLSKKFNVYWQDCSYVLAMAVVMNPMSKLNLVKQQFCLLFGEEELGSAMEAVENGVQSLYYDYVAQSLPFPSFDVGEYYEGDEKSEEAPQEGLYFSSCDDFQVMVEVPEMDEFQDIGLCIPEIQSNHQTKSELDLYLTDSVLHINQEDDFEALEWWKLYKAQYPTLTKMAADLLSMPMATVPRECVFDTSIKKVDSLRGSLKPASTEAFACAKDWLQSGIQQHPATINLES